MVENLEGKLFEFKMEDEVEFSCVLPASSNWYCPSIVSCLNGYCAVGGKSAVFLFNLQKHPPICEWDMSASPAVSIKVTAVAAMTSENIAASTTPEYIAVGLDDGLVRIIKTSSKTILKEHRKHQHRISAISWSPLTPKIVLTGDGKGMLSIWNYDENLIQIWNPISVQIMCLQMSPIKEFLFIVGYDNGNLLLADSNKLEVLCILKSHTDEICSLSWCPVSRDGLFRFASGSKDRTIRLWEVKSERAVATFRIPNKGQKKREYSRGNNFFHTILWLNEEQILSGLQNGDMLCWDTNGNYNIVGPAHERIMFAMCSDQLTNQFVTVSTDRQFIVWNGLELSPVFKIPTFGGFVYSMSTSLNNPYAVAVGVGDNAIRILSSSDSNVGYEYSNVWQGIKTKVTVVAFHPTFDGIVGFGTEDGHVGCYSMNSHKSEISTSYHRKCVYSLSWAPHYTSDISIITVRINCMYTVGGEGGILMHKMGTFNQDAENITDLIKKSNDFKVVPLRSDLAWKIDYTHFAVGNDDGTIEIYRTSTLLMVYKMSSHKKMINCMSWHHNYSSDGKGTLYSCWLASGSNEETVCVTDFSSVIGSTCDETELLHPYRLQGHTGRITRVVWNPHKNAVLASSSFDGTVQVWDVEGNAPLANFRGHIGRVYSVMWSFLDSDIVYSGGEDFTLRRWKVSQQNNITPPTVKRNKNRKKKKENQEQAVQRNTTTEGQVIAKVELNDIRLDDTCSVKTEVEGFLQGTSNVENASYSHENSAEINVRCPDIKVNVVPRITPRGEHKFEGNKKRKAKSLLKILSTSDGKKKEVMQEDCISLASYLKAQQDETTNCEETCQVDLAQEKDVSLSLFTTRHDAYNLLAAECSNHEQNESYDQLTQLEIWRSNIGGLLDKSTEKNVLNETHLALAPLGGYDMWRAALLAYAEQLERQEKYHRAAMYYLAYGDVYKAINLLKHHGYFKEALMMAKVQLSSDDPVIKELYFGRGKRLSEQCNYEQAAQCFLAIGFVEEAVTNLAKRGDSSSLLTSLRVADVYNLEKQSSNLLQQTVFMLLREQKWSVLHELLPRCLKVEVAHFQAVVGEFVVEYLFDTDVVQSVNTAVQNHKEHVFLTKQQQVYPSYVGSKTTLIDGDVLRPMPFLFKILYVLEKFCNFNKESCCDLDHIDFKQLQHGRTSSNLHLSISEVLDQVINLILHGIVYLVKGDCINCFKKWLTGFSILESSGCQSTLKVLFDSLFPSHYRSFDEIIQIFYIDNHNSSHTDSDVRQCFSNFMAFRCSGVMYEKWYSIASSNATLAEGLSKTLNGNESRSASTRTEVNFTEDPAKKYINKETLSTACDGNFANNKTLSTACAGNDFYTLVSWLSSVLLSEVHISYGKLKLELKHIEEAAMELDIKRRLNDHIQSLKQNSAQCLPVGMFANKDSNGNSYDNDVDKEVQQVCDNMINVVTKLERSNVNKLGIGDHLESEMLSSHLSRMKTHLLQTLDSFPYHIKEYAFPQPNEAVYILLFLCLSRRNDPRVVSVCDHIVSWGEQLGIHHRKKSYIGKLMNKEN